MLKRALDSVFAQTIQPWRVFVIIDELGSSDCYRFLSAFDERLLVSYTGGGKGGAVARNRGLDNIEDESYVFFLDDDDVWYPSKVEKQIALLEGNDEFVGVTCWNVRSDDSISVQRRVCERDINNRLSIWNTVGSFSFFGFRLNSATKSLRLWSELPASQDWEFYLRVKELGKIAVIEEVLVAYTVHEGPRISGNPSVKKKSLGMIYERYKEKISMRERLLHKARYHMVCAEIKENYGWTLLHVTSAILLALMSMFRGFSGIVIGRSLGTLVRK